MSDTKRYKGKKRVGYRKTAPYLRAAGVKMFDPKEDTQMTNPRLWKRGTDRDKTEGQHSRKGAKETLRQINRKQNKKARQLLKRFTQVEIDEAFDKGIYRMIKEMDEPKLVLTKEGEKLAKNLKKRNITRPTIKQKALNRIVSNIDRHLERPATRTWPKL